MRMTPRDSATAREDRVTIQAEIAAHHGSSECKKSAASVATATDSADARASVPRAPPGLPLIEENGACVGAHMQDDVGVLLLQYQCHRKPALQADPVSGRRDIGQQLALPLLAADPAGDALDRGAVDVPR